MAYVIRKLVELYFYFNEDCSGQYNWVGECITLQYLRKWIFPIDPRVRDWPMMRNPLQVLGVLTIYLFLVLKWGPNYMKNRPAYDLKWIMIVYNIGEWVGNYKSCRWLSPSSNCSSNRRLWRAGASLNVRLLPERLQPPLSTRRLFANSSRPEDSPILLRLLRAKSYRSLGHGEWWSTSINLIRSCNYTLALFRSFSFFERSRIRSRSSMSTITPEWSCSRGTASSTCPVVTAFSWVPSIVLCTWSCIRIIYWPPSIRNTRPISGGRKT